ncbi:hypothetical protein [Pseudoxanthomonas sp. CF385]|uniref:hypothetical protein n=1 Tax=Pseudoxanthomonas sp. CF385 TaxID=1881042 RepID=UPI00111403B4|nr:hypothetical protein [Pseudoxanthomonas sp. CF385]
MIKVGGHPALMDAKGQPSVDVISARRWSSAIFPDFPSDDLVRSCCTRGELVKAFAVNGLDFISVETLESNELALTAYLSEFSYAAVVLEASAELFLFKDSTNRFSVVFGDPRLVKEVEREASSDPGTDFRRWLDSADFSTVERQYLELKLAVYGSGGA